MERIQSRLCHYSCRQAVTAAVSAAEYKSVPVEMWLKLAFVGQIVLSDFGCGLSCLTDWSAVTWADPICQHSSFKLFIFILFLRGREQKCFRRLMTRIHLRTKEVMFLRLNVNGRSQNHCSLGEAISITCSECVSVALVSQHAKRMRRIILSKWPVWLYYIFPYYLIDGTIFGKLFWIYNLFRFSPQFCLKLSHSKKNWARDYHKCK